MFAVPLLGACISGDIDEERKTDTVPAGIEPERATFHIERRNDGALQALVIRLSSISMCDRKEVPSGHPFVEVEVQIPADAQFGPETCRIDQTFRCRVHLLQTVGPECNNSSGRVASSGTVTIDEVTETLVRGSFVGLNRDSQIDLSGSFVARPCGGSASCP